MGTAKREAFRELVKSADCPSRWSQFSERQFANLSSVPLIIIKYSFNAGALLIAEFEV